MGTETFPWQPREPLEAVKKGQAGLRYNGLGPWFQLSVLLEIHRSCFYIRIYICT